MRQSSPLRTCWIAAQRYALAAVTAVVLYEGLSEILDAIDYPLAGVAVWAVNTILSRNVRDYMPRANDYIEIPWQYHLKIAVGGIVLLVIGMFLGLRANLRAERQKSA